MRTVEVEQKAFPFEVGAMLLLSNGDVAIAGGPQQFEVCIYRHSYELDRGRKDKLEMVDSLDTQGCKVLQILEVYSRFILVFG